MKLCRRCGELKPLAEFHQRRRSPDGRNYYCRPCQASAMQESRTRAALGLTAYRARPRDEVQALEELREWVQEYKRTTPCADCGQCFHPIAMDFDHVGDKVAGISQMLRVGYTAQQIRGEIAKCELVCANCHRVRTMNRRLT